MAEVIIEATTAADYAAFADLIRAYIAWQQVRYRGQGEIVDRIFAHQNIDEELANLSAKYGPPLGLTLLVSRDDTYIGGAAYRDIGGGACEMKRLFILDGYQGQGSGRALATDLMLRARDAGFTTMKLDTGYLQTEAIAMYESLGFERCEPYNKYPDEYLPIIVFMQKSLVD